MDVTAWLLVAFAAIGCLLTCFGLAVRVTNKLRDTEIHITAKINDLKSLIHREFYEENDKLRHELAETLKPIQTHIATYEQKHSELELYIRDNYIEIDTFQNALGDLKTLINNISVKIEKMSEDSINWRRDNKNSRT